MQQDDRCDSCARGAPVQPLLLSDQGLELASVLQAASGSRDESATRGSGSVLPGVGSITNPCGFFTKMRPLCTLGAMKDRAARELGAEERSRCLSASDGDAAWSSWRLSQSTVALFPGVRVDPRLDDALREAADHRVALVDRPAGPWRATRGAAVCTRAACSSGSGRARGAPCRGGVARAASRRPVFSPRRRA